MIARFRKANALFDLGNLEYWCRLGLGAGLCRLLESILSLLAGHLGSQKVVPVGAEREREIRTLLMTRAKEVTYKKG